MLKNIMGTWFLAMLSWKLAGKFESPQSHLDEWIERVQGLVFA
jgi:hypothetical protein